LHWKASRGSIARLMKHRLTKPDHSISEDELFGATKQQKFIIISDSAGMGKSTLLSSLSMKLKSISGLWVLRVDLMDFSKFFNQKQSQKIPFDSKNKAIELFLEMLGSNDKPKAVVNSLEIQLLQRSFKEPGKIALLFDGFDEISPGYTSLVLKMLIALKSNYCHV